MRPLGLTAERTHVEALKQLIEGIRQRLAGIDDSDQIHHDYSSMLNADRHALSIQGLPLTIGNENRRYGFVAQPICCDEFTCVTTAFIQRNFNS